MSPKWSQVGPRCSQEGLKVPQELQVEPKCHENAAKFKQNPPLAHKMLPRWYQDAFNVPPKPERAKRVEVCSKFLSCIFKMIINILPSASLTLLLSRASRSHAKTGLCCSSWRLLVALFGLMLALLGSILLHVVPIAFKMLPRCPKMAQLSPKLRNLAPKWTFQEVKIMQKPVVF